MPLFQTTVVKKYIADLAKGDVSASWKTFAAHFHNPHIQANIRDAKEEQYQEGFLRELFVSVLGYTLNPQPHYNLTTEYKNEKDSKKADGAVLLGSSVQAVIELKGTDTTDLSKIEKQAFGYLNNQKGCTYVITSNFEKLRFYIQDATEFEEFNLFTLSEERFALLYLCLQKDNLLSGIPLQVKQQSLTQEDDITKKLYADYSRFRSALFQNLATTNPHHDRLLLFQKTQKLLDRFLFIFFAEDRLLLPPNSIREILAQWQQLKDLDNYVPLYDRFKKYFGYLNTGHKGKHHEIFAYNGGLFLPDEVLDNIGIDDEILYQHTLTLSKYNYDSEVDVNILGHIFEHSLNEIEALQAGGDAPVEKTTRRKKEGVFYTPRYITKYIVENTVGALCNEKKAALQIVEEEYAPAVKKTKKSEAVRKALVKKLDDYREWLLSLTICDPACGSGAFLNAALEFLIAEHSYVDELTNKLMGSGTLEFKWTPNDILEHNLYGVDINEEAVEIARLSLWLRTAQKGRKLSNLSNRIKVGNSLIDDKTVAGDKAFVWKEEFKDVFDNGGFDVLIGNPPYVDVKNMPNDVKEYLFLHFKTAENRINLYSTFIEKGLEVLNRHGILSYINPNSMLVNSSYKKLRYLIFDSLIEVVKLPDNVFSEAKVETVILTLKKNNQSDSVLILPYKKNDKISSIEKSYAKQILKTNWKSDDNLNFNFYSTGVENRIISKVESGSVELIQLCDFSLGLTPYDKYKGHTEEEINNRVFHSKVKLDETYKPLITGENIIRYFTKPEIEEYIRYGTWLSRPREQRFFIDERIIVRQIASGNPPRIYASYTDRPYYFTHHGFALIAKSEVKMDIKYILTLINSALLNFYHSFKFLDIEKRLFQKVLIENLKRLPIKYAKDQQSFITKADIMLSKNKELHEAKTGLLSFLKSKYENLVPSKKLTDWPQLSVKEFLTEFEKSKVKLSLTEQKEWMDYFESGKAKAATLQDIIRQTDKDIDAMVYQLYGLTEEEIKIVEGAN